MNNGIRARLDSLERAHGGNEPRAHVRLYNTSKGETGTSALAELHSAFPGFRGHFVVGEDIRKKGREASDE